MKADRLPKPMMRLPGEGMSGRRKELERQEAEYESLKSTIKYLKQRLSKIKEDMQYTQWRINVLKQLDETGLDCIEFHSKITIHKD